MTYKMQFDQPSLPASLPDMSQLQNSMNAHRRVSQMAASERSNSPISRISTPSMHHDPNIAPQHMFDGVTLNDHPFQPSPSLPALHLSQPSPGSMSSINDRSNLEPPQTYEQLLAQNATLRTRVSELEVINMVFSDNENTLRIEKEAALRRVHELEARVRELEDPDHPSKKLRLSDVTNE